MVNKLSKKIAQTWLAGQKSCVVTIPKELASKYGLLTPSYVTMEDMGDGIMIKRMEP